MSGGSKPVISVKTAEPVPKDKIFACVNALKDLCIEAPVATGDVVVANVAGTGIDLIATAEATV